MRRSQRNILLTLCLLASQILAPTHASECPSHKGVALQVLGSGGPIADDARASSGYLLWIDGKSRVLIDTGGGTLLRFGETGANFADLYFVGLSHFHADHSADFPALLKSGVFSKRKHSLVVSGPAAGGPFPGLGSFLSSLFDRDSGAFRYLAAYLDGQGDLPKLTAIEVDRNATDSVQVLGDANSVVRIDARNVPHGIVPALAFRVTVDDASVVFASDQNGNDEGFVKFATDASLLVMHMPVPENVAGAGRQLHAPPSRIGTIADQSAASSLLLSHFMARSLENLGDNVDIIKSRYAGPVYLAEDLNCYQISN